MRTSEQEVKLWQHPNQMGAYRNNLPVTVISTHVSPTDASNLGKGEPHSTIPLEVIQDYIQKLMTVGLKAVVITGGGEPLCFREINQLIIYLQHACKLHVGLITNGTLGSRLNGRAWKALDWVQINLSNIDNLESRLHINLRELLPDSTISGSIVYAGDNKQFEWLQSLRGLADRLQLRYVRVLPDYRLPPAKLIVEHRRIDAMLRRLKDKRFVHQKRVQRAPDCSTCHRAYFCP